MNTNFTNNSIITYYNKSETDKRIFYYEEEDYQGDFMVIYKTNDNKFIWNADRFHSCIQHDDEGTLDDECYEYTTSDAIIDILVEDDHNYLNKYLKENFYAFLKKNNINVDNYLNRSKLIISKNIEKQNKLNEEIRIKNINKKKLIEEKRNYEMIVETQKLLSYIMNNTTDQYYNCKQDVIRRQLRFNLDNISDDYAINNFPEWPSIKNDVQIFINK